MPLVRQKAAQILFTKMGDFQQSNAKKNNNNNKKEQQNKKTKTVHKQVEVKPVAPRHSR